MNTKKLFLMLTLLCAVVQGAKADTWDGVTKTEPRGTMTYQGVHYIGITSAAELAYICEHWGDTWTVMQINGEFIDFEDANFYLQTDIDMGDAVSWTPIKKLNGTFYGDDHTIHINIWGTSSNNQGLFAEISNTGKVQNLHVAGSIKVDNSRKVGGIAGDNYGTIENCWVSANVESNHYHSSLDADLGGIAGLNESSGTIKYCCMSGNVTNTDGNSGVGGIAGSNEGTIQHVTFYGAVSVEHAQDNIYVGDQDKSLSDQHSSDLYDETALRNYLSGIGGNEMYCKAVERKWADNHPKWTDAGSHSTEYSHVDGNTIYIDSEGDLALLAFNTLSGTANYWDKTFVLTRDLDLGGKDWVPIGGPAGEFNGNFDGGNHIISNLTIHNGVYGYHTGLFGEVEGTQSLYTGNGGPIVTIKGCEFIKNITLKNVDIRGGKYTGSIAGFVRGVVVLENLVTDGGNIWGQGSSGGLIGYMEGWDVEGMKGYVTAKNCLFINGKVYSATENYDELPYEHNSYLMFGEIYNTSTFTNNYFAGVPEANEDHYTVRSYPIVANIPSGLDFSYESTTGIAYDGKFYVPDGASVKFRLSYKNYLRIVSSVKVNGVEVGTAAGEYTFTIDSSQADAYTITVECTDLLSSSHGNSEADPILITSTSDWDAFASTVNNDAIMFVNKFVKLTNDISVTTMVGLNKNVYFQGTFLGDGHTLTFTQGSSSEAFGEEYCAPFRYIRNATIRDLKVAGEIYTSRKFAAGLVAYSSGETNIISCQVGTVIYSNVSGDGTHGGIVAYPNGELNIEGCVYDGQLLTNSGTLYCGGFVGWHNGATIKVSNSLYAPGNIPADWTAINNGATFVRGGNPAITNCYYTKTLDTAQGTQCFPVTAEPTNLGSLVQDYGMVKAYANGILCDGTYHMKSIVISLADNADNSSTISEHNGYLADVTLEGRTLYKDGAWNTLCLPFSVGDADASVGHGFDGTPLEGATVMTLANSAGSSTGFDSNTGLLSLYFVEANQIEAGVPYIVKWPEVGSNIVSPVFEGVTIENEVPADKCVTSSDGAVSFAGIYSPTALFTTVHTNYYLGADNKLYYPSRESFQLGAFRCYFRLNDPSLSVKGFVLSFDDDATGIQEIQNSNFKNQNEDDAVYDLSGRKVANRKLTNGQIQQGIYVKGGKKVVIK